MKDALYVHVCIMYVVEHACWDYYTQEIERVNTPEDNLRSTWELSRNWAAHPHLWATIQETLIAGTSPLGTTNLEFMQIPMGVSEYATEALELCWTLVSKRAWAMSKHSAPAECYSEILRPGNEHEPERLACAAKMKLQHENILSLEQAIHRNDDARPVWKACFFSTCSLYGCCLNISDVISTVSLHHLGGTSSWGLTHSWQIIKWRRTFMHHFA